jgi:hypothetical protein
VINIRTWLANFRDKISKATLGVASIELKRMQAILQIGSPVGTLKLNHACNSFSNGPTQKHLSTTLTGVTMTTLIILGRAASLLLTH